MSSNPLGKETKKPVKYTGVYAETGTSVSGYGTDGPYSCGECIHESKSGCYHPAVMKDPKLKKDKQKDGSIKIDEEHGCCRFVSPREPDEDEDSEETEDKDEDDKIDGE